MPSIPQSLLWISLVVLWLFVLVPMLINKRDAVRRTSDVALATRVLTSGTGARLLRRTGPAAGHRGDPNWQPAGDTSIEVDDVNINVDIDEDLGKRAMAVAVSATTVAAIEPDYLDVEVVDEEFDEQPTGQDGAAAAKDAPAEAAEADEAADNDEADPESESESEFESDFDEETGDSTGRQAPERGDSRVTESLVQARRHRYQSTTAAAVSARKYRFRMRTLAVMAIAVVACATVAYTAAPVVWWACGSVSAVTVLYLAYLRRQTRIEQTVRRRRAQRVARSRLGVENTADREFDVVPSRLRRPGAVVLEIDDEDPIFEHLDDAPQLRDYHLLRAAGQ